MCPHQLVSEPWSIARELLEEVKYLPKLSLESSALEYFEWEESLDDFFYGRWLSDIYYAEETLAKDLFYWWIDYNKKFPCDTWSDMKTVIQDLFLSPFALRKMIAEDYGSTSRTTKAIDILSIRIKQILSYRRRLQ